MKVNGPDNCVKKKTFDIKSVLGSTSSTSGSSGSSTKNIWVSGLSSNTKAADLKNLFGKYGKVHSFHLFIHLSGMSIWEEDYIQNSIT